jgi:predicted nucleic acid-binding Zn finger protein
MTTLTTAILAKVDGQRLQKAVEALVSGAYAITLTAQSETEIRAFITNGDGKAYAVVLSEGRSFCACADHMFRHSTCKHMTAVALHVIRAPKAEGAVVSC